MKQTLGLAKFRRTVWQHDGTRPGWWWNGYTPSSMTELLPSNARGGTPGPPTHLATTHVIFVGGDNQKTKCTTTSPCKHQNMSAMKRKARIELSKSSGVMFQKSIMNIKKRTALRAGVEGQHFEGRRQAVEEYINEICNTLMKYQKKPSSYMWYCDSPIIVIMKFSNQTLNNWMNTIGF